ncbi:MAG: MFS transporter [Clostridia bacterium]|nr:MFS transporter [Clostridia bacterium]
MSELAASVQRKRMLRIIPYVFLLYIVAYLDRVNVGFAALEMNKALGFDPAVFGLGSGIFFFGYFILEIPSTVMVERWSARRWIARILVTWGVVAILMAFIRTPWQFYLVRFILGLAEAGFFPGIILYLTHWFRQEEQARAVALFMSALAVSNIVGAPVSGYILQHVHWLGLAGWQWVYILEGLPAVVLGFLNIWLMADRPAEARWLTDQEKRWLEGELERETAAVRQRHQLTLWQGLLRWDTWRLALIYFFWITGFYGFGIWFPTILKHITTSQNDLLVGLLTAAAYIPALVAMILAGRHSDRTGERKFHLFTAIVAGAAALLISALAGGQVVLAFAFFTLAAIGIYSAFGPFWSLPSTFLTDDARAAGIGLVNSVGNLGGFVGPFAVGYLNKATGQFLSGLLFLIASLLVAGLLVLTLRREPEAAAAAAAAGGWPGRSEGA